jgi:uncharacterized protein (TIGR03083 family)
MAKPSPWPTIAAEREALADDLESLTDKRWSTPSLCDAWTVQEVLGHMTAAAEMTPAKFFPSLIASGFSLNMLSAKDVAKRTTGSGKDTLTRFRSRIDSRNHPPGPIDTWLGEAIVHSEDIRRPLKIKHEYPADTLVRVMDFYKGSNLVVGGKRRASGLTLRATDADWSSGSGPEVTGPLISLIMAIVGRGAALKDLKGAGLQTLQSRM